MSERLPAVTSKTLLKVLAKQGFVEVRRSGSHAIMKHADGRRTTVPMHSGKTLGRGLLRQIMRDTGLTAEDLRK